MGLFRIFSRRHGKTAERPAGDSDQWQVGDQAECIFAGPWRSIVGGAVGEGPALSDVRVVTDVKVGLVVVEGAPLAFLSFARWPGRVYDANCFRKVTPRADEAVAADAAWTGALLWQPSRKPEPVE